VKKVLLFAVVFVLIVSISSATIYAQSQYEIPSWVKGVAAFWAEGNISDEEFGEGLTFLIDSEIIKVPKIQELENRIAELERENKELRENESSTQSLQSCSGSARCITGTVTKVIDGDTIKVDGQSIRFALASAPELGGYGAGVKETEFIQKICPVGSEALVDEDDGQTQGSYGRIIGVVYCNGMNLNAELLDSGLGYMEFRFCDISEFGDSDWAVKHGCKSKVTVTENDCDPSYPDFCIPPYPPDLDCGEINYSNFRVIGSDPHGFDGDNDGIGCES